MLTIGRRLLKVARRSTGKPFIRLAMLHYRGNVTPMAIAQSKVTAQGQISVPAEVRKKLGAGPGSTLEWTEEGGKVIVRRVGRYNWNDVRAAIFGGKSPKPRSVVELKAGLRRHIRRKHARD